MASGVQTRRRHESQRYIEDERGSAGWKTRLYRLALRTRLQAKVSSCGLVGGSGGYGDAHVFEAGASAAFFFGAGVALDDFAKFLDSGILLT